MGIITHASQRLEIEEIRRMLLSCATIHRKTDSNEEFSNEFKSHENILSRQERDDDVVGEKLVCVTSGVSFLGISIVKQLLLGGYNVRLVVDNEEDVEKLREMQISGEMRGSHNGIEAVMANLTEVQSLRNAFNGCCGVFHTAAFIDPAGTSGYTKSMVGVEVNVSKNVMEACADTVTVKHCVFTSSLLACIWQNNSPNNLPTIIDHNSWSDESVCLDKKLWYALGKLKAEKAAWDVARERGFKLATVCPALVTGPEFSKRNSTPTIAYLKGARKMFVEGILATVDVEKLANAHVAIYEGMGKTASGRYICYDQEITSEDEVEKLARDSGIDVNMLRDENTSVQVNPFRLSNSKLSRLMLTRTPRCYRDC